MISWGKYNHRGIFHRTADENPAAYNQKALCGVYLYGPPGKHDWYMPYDVRPTCKNCKRVKKVRKR